MACMKRHTDHRITRNQDTTRIAATPVLGLALRIAPSRVSAKMSLHLLSAKYARNLFRAEILFSSRNNRSASERTPAWVQHNSGLHRHHGITLHVDSHVEAGKGLGQVHQQRIHGRKQMQTPATSQPDDRVPEQSVDSFDVGKNSQGIEPETLRMVKPFSSNVPQVQITPKSLFVHVTVFCFLSLLLS